MKRSTVKSYNALQSTSSESGPNRFTFQHPLIYGTIILTASGLICRIVGFAFRIFLSRALGAEGLGLYQMAFPVLNLCFACCCAGFSTAISRSIAAAKDRSILTAGLLFSCGLAIPLSILLYRYAEPISRLIMQEPRCAPLLQLLAISVPFSAIHACHCGYYYGLQKPTYPALAQLLEQAVRVGVTWLFWRYCLAQGQQMQPWHAVCSVLFSEGVSALFLVCVRPFVHIPGLMRSGSLSSHVKPILHMAAPLTANRLMLSGLSSLEAIMIPFCLRRCGLPAPEALEIYGIITGMVMPFLFFPSALTNSAAVMLLPEVAQAQAKNQHEKIRRTTSMNLLFCCSLGIACTLFFLLFGRFLGDFFYSNATAGQFLTILSWLCPFLYMGNTIGSILNGLGDTGGVFLHNIISALIRLGFLWFLTPQLGIRAWLWGMLAAEIILLGLHLISLWKELRQIDHSR